MEQDTQTSADAQAAQSQVAPPQAPKPVMDVVPPPTVKTEQPSQEQSASQPIAQQPAEAAKSDDKAAVTPEPAKDDKPAPASAKPKQPSTAPVGVIVVAVILFVVLSALAYYAYSKG